MPILGSKFHSLITTVVEMSLFSDGGENNYTNKSVSHLISIQIFLIVFPLIYLI